MSYWAHFQQYAGATFRLDTRIYLHPSGQPGPDDVCVAAVVGKNPGSAAPGPSGMGTLAPVALGPDNMLPFVRNCFILAYEMAGKPIPSGAFVRVWNLFYLCNPNLQSAIAAYNTIKNPPVCISENSIPRIVWFAWGGSGANLNHLKQRFLNAQITNYAFFYCKNQGQVVPAVPRVSDFAKHTQGMPQMPIVDFLAPIV